MLKTLTAAGLALCAGAAIAQTAPPAAAAPLVRMADHVMTRGEVQAKVRDHFARFDADQDGTISTAEIAQLHGAMGGHGGPRAMMHGGGHGDPAAAFDRLDANKDGMISRDEFAKGREMRMEKRVAINGRKGGGKRQMRVHRGGMGMGMGMGGGRMIAMADSNHDGRVTLAEAEAMALQHFDKMDADRDGRVTRDERRAGRPLMIKQFREKRTAG
ncbi:MAG: EF-hand domain-containing protein [Sphingomonas sp.]|uniref:EF-hand domain-containing protein n=1 Tax=Sphingomonas sp. TaxID=28214 RepID=UPI00179B4916|nr:EF-hand domain-containing protein [Sphingomonas sp.]MBA3666833.1 EF-hand domain-containing protein [Sphingomonas sp.]